MQSDLVSSLVPTQFALGKRHTVLFGDGRFYGFGSGTSGQFGHVQGLMSQMQATEIKFAFTHLAAANGNQKGGSGSGSGTMLACGNKHTLILQDGNVYATGENSFGRLGLAGSRGKTEGRLLFGQGYEDKIGFITCGPDHSIAVSQDGFTLYCWGACDKMGVGHPAKLRSALREEKENQGSYDSPFGDGDGAIGPDGVAIDLEPYIPIPRRFNLWKYDPKHPHRIVQVSCGAQHTIALREDGWVYTWGDGSDGRLGHNGAESLSTPTPMQSFMKSEYEQVVAVCAGHSHSMALDREGKVWTWGSCSWGKLGHPELQQTQANLYQPKVVKGITRDKEGVVSIHCNAYHSLAVTNMHRLFVWGGNEFGRLGLGDTKHRWEPVEVLGLPKVLRAACGLNHTVAVTEGGAVFAWGQAMQSLCGIPPDRGMKSFSKPRKIAFFDDKGIYKNFKESAMLFTSRRYTPLAIATGEAHSLALCEGSQLVSFGSNAYGQLGTGQQTHSDRPIPIAPFLEEHVFIRSIACGANHSLLLASNGEMYSFGANNYGQLGLSTTTNARTPLPIKSLATTHVESIACGANTCAAIERRVTPDGHILHRIYTWGDNTFGQAGLGSKIKRQDHPALIQFPRASDFHRIDISIGTQHMLLLGKNFDLDKPEGGVISRSRLYAVGRGAHGQLGILTDSRDVVWELTKVRRFEGWRRVLAENGLEDPVKGRRRRRMERARRRRAKRLGGRKRTPELENEDDDMDEDETLIITQSDDEWADARMDEDSSDEEGSGGNTTLDGGDGEEGVVAPTRRKAASSRRSIRDAYPRIQSISAGELASVAAVQRFETKSMDFVFAWGRHEGLFMDGGGNGSSASNGDTSGGGAGTAASNSSSSTGGGGGGGGSGAIDQLIPRFVSAFEGDNLREELGSKQPIFDFRIRSVVCARKHCLVLAVYNMEQFNPVVFAWGDTTFGRLGVGIVHKYLHAKQQQLRLQQSSSKSASGADNGTTADGLEKKYLPPSLIPGLSLNGKVITAVASFADHTLAISKPNGTIYGWGMVDHGRLGLSDGGNDGASARTVDEPKQLPAFVPGGDGAGSGGDRAGAGGADAAAMGMGMGMSAGSGGSALGGGGFGGVADPFSGMDTGGMAVSPGAAPSGGGYAGSPLSGGFDGGMTGMDGGAAAGGFGGVGGMGAAAGMMSPTGMDGFSTGADFGGMPGMAMSPGMSPGSMSLAGSGMGSGMMSGHGSMALANGSMVGSASGISSPTSSHGSMSEASLAVHAGQQTKAIKYSKAMLQAMEAEARSQIGPLAKLYEQELAQYNEYKTKLDTQKDLLHKMILERLNQSQSDPGSLTKRANVRRKAREAARLAEARAAQEAKLGVKRSWWAKLTGKNKPLKGEQDGTSNALSSSFVDPDIDASSFVRLAHSSELNVVEECLGRLYLRPCLLFQFFQCCQRSIEFKEHHVKDAASAALEIQFIKADAVDLIFSVYDPYYERDQRLLQVFMKMMLAQHVQINRSELIMHADKIEWLVFSRACMSGKMRRQLGDILAAAISKLRDYDQSPAALLHNDRNGRSKDVNDIRTAIRKIREKGDELVTLLCTYDDGQFVRDLINCAAPYWELLYEALSKSSHKDPKVFGRVILSVCMEVAIADMPYQFERILREKAKDRMRSRSARGSSARNSRWGGGASRKNSFTSSRRNSALQRLNVFDGPQYSGNATPKPGRRGGGGGGGGGGALSMIDDEADIEEKVEESRYESNKLVLLNLLDPRDLKEYMAERYQIEKAVLDQTVDGKGSNKSDVNGGVSGMGMSGGGVSSNDDREQTLSRMRIFSFELGRVVASRRVDDPNLGSYDTQKVQLERDLYSDFVTVRSKCHRRIAQLTRSSLLTLSEHAPELFNPSNSDAFRHKIRGLEEFVAGFEERDTTRVNVRHDAYNTDRFAKVTKCAECGLLHPYAAQLEQKQGAAGMGGGSADGEGKRSSMASALLESHHNPASGGGKRDEEEHRFPTEDCLALWSVLNEPHLRSIIHSRAGATAWKEVESKLEELTAFFKKAGSKDDVQSDRYLQANTFFRQFARCHRTVDKKVFIYFGTESMHAIPADTLEPIDLFQHLTQLSTNLQVDNLADRNKALVAQTILQHMSVENRALEEQDELMAAEYRQLHSATPNRSAIPDQQFKMLTPPEREIFHREKVEQDIGEMSVYIDTKGHLYSYTYPQLVKMRVLQRVENDPAKASLYPLSCLPKTCCAPWRSKDETKLAQFLLALRFLFNTGSTEHHRLEFILMHANTSKLFTTTLDLHQLAKDGATFHISYEPRGDSVEIQDRVDFIFNLQHLLPFLRNMSRPRIHGQNQKEQIPTPGLQLLGWDESKFK